MAGLRNRLYFNDQNLQNAKPVNNIIGIISCFQLFCVSHTNIVMSRQIMKITIHIFLLNLLLLFIIFYANASAVFEDFIIAEVLIRL